MVARGRKERKYCELLDSRRCRLVVLAMEVGGRWSEEAYNFVVLLSGEKAKAVPRILQRSTSYCLLRRWMQMISVAAMTGFAASLLEENTGQTSLCNGELPDWGEVLYDRDVGADGVSKLV